MSSSMSRVRPFLVLVHRYAGLYMALFLLVAGITGSLIALAPQIESMLHPVRKVAVHPGGMLDPLTLREKAERSVPHALANWVPLDRKRGEAVAVSLTARNDSSTGKPYDLIADTVMLDPYTGDVVSRTKASGRLWPIDRDNFLALVVALHYTLLLPGSWGIWLFGIAALLWTIDCFVSAYLTFPLSARSKAAPDQARRPWWRRWKLSWQVKWRGSFYRVNFDLHRAGGLWLWLLLLALAWSSVGFNLSEQVYSPVMRTVFGTRDLFAGRPVLARPIEDPAWGWSQAYTAARQAMMEQSRLQGVVVVAEQGLAYLPERAVYLYAVRSNRDLSEEGGNTFLLIDANDGHYLGLSVPRGQNAGTTLESWIFALHTASIGGLPYRILLCATGFALAWLSITGVYIWWKKRCARRFKHNANFERAIVETP